MFSFFSPRAFLSRYKGQLVLLLDPFHRMLNPDLPFIISLFFIFKFLFCNKGLITQVWGVPFLLLPIPTNPLNYLHYVQLGRIDHPQQFTSEIIKLSTLIDNENAVIIRLHLIQCLNTNYWKCWDMLWNQQTIFRFRSACVSHQSINILKRLQYHC